MNSYEETAKVFKAFDDPNRLYIISLIGGSEKCACDILENLQISQPTLSHHMKILCESGIVKLRKDGKRSLYSLSETGLILAAKYIFSIFPKSA